jgi:hypothetical protein
VHGAAKRLRPKFTKVATTFTGFIPIMWATGTASDVWKRIAAPMIGSRPSSAAGHPSEVPRDSDLSHRQGSLMPGRLEFKIS